MDKDKSNYFIKRIQLLKNRNVCGKTHTDLKTNLCLIFRSCTSDPNEIYATMFSIYSLRGAVQSQTMLLQRYKVLL